MQWLNYHHLYYFYTIAQEGSITAAARKLKLSHPTLSAQLKALEQHFGSPLFERRSARLQLTSFGQQTFLYAQDIFRLGHELGELASGKRAVGKERLRIGVTAGIPKTLAHHLLSPALDEAPNGATLVTTGAMPSLIGDLRAGRLHAVLSNDVQTTDGSVPIHAHALGESEILLYATATLAKRARKLSTSGLAELSFVLPPRGAPLRRRLDEWFAAHNLEPLICAEVEDAGLMHAFAIAGRGVVPVRAVLQQEIESVGRLSRVGLCDGVRERFYLLTTDRKLKHPALLAIAESARAELLQPKRARRKKAT
jgi:LysR family transcriptional activator of nhaA